MRSLGKLSIVSETVRELSEPKVLSGVIWAQVFEGKSSKQIKTRAEDRRDIAEILLIRASELSKSNP